MTEQELREKFVHAIGDYYGAKEGDAKHADLLKWYNSLSPLPRGYKMKTHDAWCAATPSAISNKLGLTDIIFPECGCGKMIDLYKKHGRWVEKDNFVPQTGDLIFYDWDDNGVGDNHGSPWHVGTVVRVTNGIIRVMEGNMDHRVWHRDVPIDGRYIRGFACPDYASKTNQGGNHMKFIDVKDSDWYTDAVYYCQENGLMTGSPGGRFRPKDPLTRAEMAAILKTLIEKLK